MISRKRNARGYFGIGICYAKKEANIGTLMRSAYCFGANFIFTVGRRYTRQASDTVHCAKWLPCYHYENIAELRDKMPQDCMLIGIEQSDKSLDLGNYAHADRAVYLLGAEDHGLPEKDIAVCDEVIQIPGTSRCLNVSVAGSIVLYDRIAYRARVREYV